MIKRYGVFRSDADAIEPPVHKHEAGDRASPDTVVRRARQGNRQRHQQGLNSIRKQFIV